MTFSLSDFAGLPVQAPLKLEVAMEAVAGVLDITVEDKEVQKSEVRGLARRRGIGDATRFSTNQPAGRRETPRG